MRVVVAEVAIDDSEPWLRARLAGGGGEASARAALLGSMLLPPLLPPIGMRVCRPRACGGGEVGKGGEGGEETKRDKKRAK